MAPQPVDLDPDRQGRFGRGHSLLLLLLPVSWTSTCAGDVSPLGEKRQRVARTKAGLPSGQQVSQTNTEQPIKHGHQPQSVNVCWHRILLGPFVTFCSRTCLTFYSAAFIRFHESSIHFCQHFERKLCTQLAARVHLAALVMT